MTWLALWTNFPFLPPRLSLYWKVTLNHSKNRQSDISSILRNILVQLLHLNYVFPTTWFFHNLRIIIFHNQRTLPLNFTITSVSLRHYASTKIFADYFFFVSFDLFWRQKQPPGVFCKKDVLKHFANFTGKHLRSSLFSIKLQAF